MAESVDWARGKIKVRVPVQEEGSQSWGEQDKEITLSELAARMSTLPQEDMSTQIITPDPDEVGTEAAIVE